MKKISLLFAFLMVCGTIFAQERSLSGRITGNGSESGLTGAHITISGSNSNKVLFQGISGRDGEFSVSKLPSEKLTLTVSFMGYRFWSEVVNLEEGNIPSIEIVLIASPVEVGEVIVSASRQDRMLRDVSLPLSLVTMNRIDQLPALTISNLCQEMPGVSLARDGIWATSLNIRGLTEQRIVTLIDGNRIETATDIAAGLALIDVNDIERVEVIKGAASSLYGTGALGGVVNIITRKGNYYDDFYVGGSVVGMAQTVNKMHSENISLDLADEKWFVRLAGTYRDADNTMTPEGELLNSQFTDNNFSLKIGVKPFKNQELKINYQSFNASDVGIPGGVAFPLTASAEYSDILRNMFSASYTIRKENGYLSQVKFKYFHQYILRDVELRPSAAVLITPSGYHTTNGFQTQTDWSFGSNHQLIAGIDVWQRYLSTEREKTVRSVTQDSAGNVTGSNVVIRGEVPIPDACFTSGGLYIQDQISLLEGRMDLTLGGRFDMINTRNDQAVDPLYVSNNGILNLNPPNQRISFEADNINNYSWSADAGALFHLTPAADLSLTLSKSYRAPGIEERFKYIDLGSLVKIGDPNLKPEQGYFFDLGTRIWMDKFQLTGNVFANAMSNLIVESPGIFVYNYTAQPENFDTLSALINSNVEKALLYGFDVSAGYNVYDGFTVTAMAGYVRGRNTLKDTDLPQIPGLNGRLAVKYKLEGLLNAEVAANLVADQDKIAEGEKASRGFASYDLGIYSVPVRIWDFRLEAFGGIHNITDRAYMNHLSTNRGVVKYEPGRNFYLKMRLSF